MSRMSALTTFRLIGSPRNPGSPYILPWDPGSTTFCAAAERASVLAIVNISTIFLTAPLNLLREFMFPPFLIDQRKCLVGLLWVGSMFVTSNLSGFFSLLGLLWCGRLFVHLVQR